MIKRGQGCRCEGQLEGGEVKLRAEPRHSFTKAEII